MKTFLNYRAQGTIEMIFAMVIIILMVYSVLKVGAWSGIEILKVQNDHEVSLQQDASFVFTDFRDGPIKQVDPQFHNPAMTNAAGLNF